MLADQINEALIKEVNFRIFDECVPRIKKCLVRLTEEQIWARPNQSSNSIGNLVLHLCGNVRQWILSGISGEDDIRQRQKEFDETCPVPVAELHEKLDQLEVDVREALAMVRADQLLEVKPVQVYMESVLTILIHVTEHFSYHTGQIAWITKMLTDKDLGFYADQDLG